jgi:hypothetical protein
MRTILLSLLVLSILSCNNFERGSGRIISETKSVSNFNAIKVSNSIDVEIMQGDKTEVIVEADDNVINFVEVKSINNELYISYKSGTTIMNSQVVVKVTAPEFTKIKASASSTVLGKNTLSTSNTFEVNASSSSEITIEVDAPTVKLDANSSAEINISGKTKNIFIEASSSAAINAENLKAETAEATANSSGSIYVFASVQLKANASSSGEVAYTGGVKDVQKNESSSGEVIAR